MGDVACSCGEVGAHVIIRRVTADGLHVCGWDDGSISGVLGYRIPGVPMVRPRTAAAIATARVVMRLFMGEACIHTRASLPRLYEACLKVGRGRGVPGDVRALLSRPADIAIPWTTTSADRDGRPRERQAVFRMGPLAGTAIVWERNWGYEVGYVERPNRRSADSVFRTLGFRFRTARELQAHLRELIELNAREVNRG